MRGKIENLRAQPDFWQQNRRSRKRKTGVWSGDLRFSPHFRKRRPEVCGNFRNPRAHRHFQAKKPQVEALPLSGAVGMSGICRILPDLTFCLTLIPSQSAAKRRAPFLICLESCLWGGGFAVFGRAPARTGLFGSSASRPPSEDVLKTGLKLPLAYIDSVQYACLTMAKVDFRGGVRHGGAGCWQHCVC